MERKSAFLIRFRQYPDVRSDLSRAASAGGRDEAASARTTVQDATEGMAMATMKEVAALAGVSLSTVSFTINGTKPVSDELRSRVEEAMRRLDYRPNALGRALASRRTRIVALLYPMQGHAAGEIAGRFFTSATERAAERGYNLVLWPGDDHERISDLCRSGIVDGALLMEVGLDDPRVALFAREGVPVAMIGRTRRPESVPHVDIDFEGTIAAAVEHLAERGHRRIALLDGMPDDAGARLVAYGPAVRTREAFLRETAARGIRGELHGCEGTHAAGRDAADALLERRPATTAVVASSENALRGLVSRLRERGVAIPGGVSIAAVTTSPALPESMEPTLTAWDSPAATLGALGVDLLLQVLGEARADEAPLTGTLVPCPFRPGASTGPAQSSRAMTQP